MNRASWVLFCLVSACLPPLTGCQAPRADRPDIFLLSIDTLRADHLGCYGYARNTSPALDRFAADAVLFENAQAHAPETRPSFSSLLSGFLPHETKTGIAGIPLVPEIDTLAEKLGDEGYATAAVVSNYVLRRQEGWDQGFDVYDDTMQQRELQRNFPERTAEYTTDRAIELLEQSDGQPLFMWVHYQDPHGPYTPPESTAELFDEDGASPRPLPLNETLSGRGGIPSYQKLGEQRDFHHYLSRYDAEIRFADEQLGRLLDKLVELGRFDDAVIVFTSDHGENMGDHDYFFCHGENLYGGLTRVPLMVRFGDGRRGRRGDVVQHIDLVPTLMSLLGLAPDERHRGIDLRETGVEREVLAEARSPHATDGVQVSLVRDGYKLIATPAAQRYELFELAADPSETNDLAGDPVHAPRIEQMILAINGIVGVDRLQIEEPAPRELSEEEKEKLRSLGYSR